MPITAPTTTSESPCRMITVNMRDEPRPESFDVERCEFWSGFHDASLHPGARVEQVERPASDDPDARACTLGAELRRPDTKYDGCGAQRAEVTLS